MAIVALYILGATGQEPLARSANLTLAKTTTSSAVIYYCNQNEVEIKAS